MPCSASSGSSSASCRIRSRRGSLARRNEKTSSPPLPDERGRQAERRVVLGLQPELEHESPSPRSSRWRPSLHGRSDARERAETVVDPARELPLERRVAGVAAAGAARARRARRGRARAPIGRPRQRGRPAGRGRRAGGRARSGRRGPGRGRARWRRGRRRTRPPQTAAAPPRSRSSVACTLASSVAPQNACQPPSPCSRYGWTRPSATRAAARARRPRRPPARCRRAPPQASPRAGSARERRTPGVRTVPSGARVKRDAVASCCQTSSSTT